MGQRRIGLTGGIGTGKSTVATLLQAQTIPVIDADQIARQALQPGSDLLPVVIEHFGSCILTPSGQLDRRLLGQQVFTDPAAKAWLESQIHPVVKTSIRQWVSDHDSDPILCLMIPLLFEAQMTDWVNEIWVVTCSVEVQRQRIQQRDSLSLTEIEDRLESQWSMTQKVELADVVIDNSGSVEDLREQCLLALATRACHQFRGNNDHRPSTHNFLPGSKNNV